MKPIPNLTIILTVTIVCVTAQGSTCPQTRRADTTDHSKFYYCIELPNTSTGHVWIPAQCNYGLVFQSVLGMCVLNQTSACVNGLDNSCNFIQNSTSLEAVETPHTAPDLAEILSLNFKKENYSTTLRNYEVQASTNLPVNQNNTLSTSFKELLHGPTTNPTSIIPERIKTSQTNSEINSYVSTNNWITLTVPTTRSWQILPCTTGVRMPNLTDCTKYYICNFTSHAVYEYSCPPHTTFNQFKHICEANASVTCYVQDYHQSTLAASITTTTTRERNACDKPGSRTPDPQSNRHYQYCFYLYGKLVLHRLSCPTGLYYCPILRICETQENCPTYNQ